MPADERNPHPLPDAPGHRAGQTTTFKDGLRAPKQPHERDESAGSQESAPRDVMRQAQEDVERGLVDTSRAEATDATYERNLRSEPQAATPAADDTKSGKKNEPG